MKNIDEQTLEVIDDCLLSFRKLRVLQSTLIHKKKLIRDKLNDMENGSDSKSIIFNSNYMEGYKNALQWILETLNNPNP